MGLSNPPLRRRTPARTTSNPHVLRIHATGLRLVLHAANQGAPVWKDREATPFHVGHEDAARPTRGAESAESAREAVEVDRATMDRVDGNRVAPAEGREDLRAPRADIVALSAHAGGTVRTPCDADPLDPRAPTVDDEQVARWGVPDEEAQTLARLDRADLGGHRIEDASGLAGRQAAGGQGFRVETPETSRVGRSDGEDHPVRRDRARVDERHVPVDRRFVEEEAGLEVIGAV